MATMIPMDKLMATGLSLGADLKVRGIGVEERDKTLPSSSYTNQQLSAYLITDLSKDVEATIRVQSIQPWGVENSTNPLSTRYPDANGGVWIQNAFVRLPSIWKNRIALTIGRQPIVWGDGAILSDDDLGFNAVRLQINSPFDWLNADLDSFSAKINETFAQKQDADLYGVQLGLNRDAVRWEIMGLFENDKTPQGYAMGSSSTPTTATHIKRQIYGIRAKTNLKDAFLRGEYYIQRGNVDRSDANDIELAGTAYVIGLGGSKDTKKIGNFGAILEVAEGDGDSAETPNEDEAFRPTYASRWDGLDRKGYGQYFASSFSDAYNPSDPFASTSSLNDGLPEGASGIQSIHFGMELTPWAAWTFNFDYFQYRAKKGNSEVNQLTNKELGVEFDYSLTYRFSGLVTFKATHNRFNPGDAYEADKQQTAVKNTIEAVIQF